MQVKNAAFSLILLMLIDRSTGHASITVTPIPVTQLRCEGLTDPLAIDTTRPRLSWILESDRRGERQTAYQILVASSPELLARQTGDLWDSGKVGSDESLHIPYVGKPLESRKRCYWKVRVWTNLPAPKSLRGKDPVWSLPGSWTMGLLKPEDFKGHWITASKWYMPPDFRPPGFITIESDNAESPAWAQVDLGKSMLIDSVKVYPYRPQAFPVRFRIEAADDLDSDRPKVIADCSGEDYRLGKDGPVEFPGNGVTARWVRILILKSPPVKPGAKTFSSIVRQMEVWSGGRNAALMRPTLESGHYWDRGHATFMVDGMPSASDGDICPEDACPTTAAPLLRKAFQLDRPVKRAMLYYAAPGMAELSINGTKVGDAVLDPPFTDYSKRIVYRTYDVTGMLASGENVIGATLGNGFFSTPGRGFGERQNGDGQPRLLSQVELEFSDETRQTIATDQTWKWAQSTITFNDIWRGYTEDRRLAKPGWDRPGFVDSNWRPVGLAESLGGVFCSAMGPAVRVVGQLKPVRVEGNTAFFDVLTSGWPRVKVNGKAGQVIQIQGDCGVAPSRFTLAADGPTVLEPRFVYFSGPHQLQVAGLSEPLTIDAVSFQEAHADFHFTGAFHCSNPYLNQLHDVVLRTHTNYDLEHPLDPMREKQGWTQDAQNMFDTAAYLTDVSGLYRKWWWDMADNQQPNGLLGSVVPLVARQIDDWNCPWWSGMIAWLPWQHYLYYGDRRMLEDAYEPMRKYVEYLEHLASIGGGTRALDYPDPHYFLNADAASKRLLVWTGASDWLNPFGGPPGPLMNMTGWYYYATVVSKTAAILGKKADAARFAAMAEDVRKRCNAEYLNLQTGLYAGQGNNESAQVMPLALGVVPYAIRPLTFQRLLDAIHTRHDHHGTGFVALPYLLQILTESYQGALANRIVNQQDYPSWKTLMHDGVLAESWNGGGAQMPSCGGAVGMWLYQSVLGIRPDPSSPGFKRFILAPQPDPATGLTEAQGWYDSIRGRIASHWNISGGKIFMDITVPANTMATVRVPTADPQQVSEGGRPVTHAEGVKLLRREADALFIEVGSGTYHFAAAAPPLVDLPTAPARPGKPAGSFSDSLKAPASDWKAAAGQWTPEQGEWVAHGTGTYAITDRWWRDATISVRCRILDSGGDPQNWAGLSVRKSAPQDVHDESGYLVYLRADGRLGLFRTGTTLKEVKTGLDPFKPVVIRVSVSGKAIRVFLNDETAPRIEASDTDFESGYVSLATCGPTAAFTDFSVVVSGEKDAKQ